MLLLTTMPKPPKSPKSKAAHAKFMIARGMRLYWQKRKKEERKLKRDEAAKRKEKGQQFVYSVASNTPKPKAPLETDTADRAGLKSPSPATKSAIEEVLANIDLSDLGSCRGQDE
jgi:hypothetical protein